MTRFIDPCAPLRRAPLLIALLLPLLSLFASSTAEASQCQWKVKGRVLVEDRYFNEATVPLKSASVRIYATTVPGDIGWRFWAEKSVNSSGYFSATVKPAESDPIGCAKKRRFKVKLKLANSDVKIMHHPIPTEWNEEILRTGKKSKADPVDLGTVELDTYDDAYPLTAITDYTQTHAAVMFLAYQELTELLRSWGLSPQQAKLVYPDGPGTSDYFGWSDPACCVKVARNWFTHGTKDWRRRELTHELMHQWFNDHVFVPFFISGNTPGTHDFLETSELALYEEFAEWAAVAINQAIWGVVPSDSDNHNDYVCSRRGIYDAFVDATGGPGDTSYWSAAEVQAMIDDNNAEWNDLLGRAQVSVMNYLRLLTVEDWFFLRYGDDYTSGSARAERRWPAHLHYDCDSLHSPMFTPKKLLQLFAEWKQSSPGDVIPTPRGILDFYSFLADEDAHFGTVKRYFRRFGNPHFTSYDFLEDDFCDFSPPTPAADDTIGG